MKKTMTRMLSLLLVLILIFSVVPTALADQTSEGDQDETVTETPSISLSAKTTATVGEIVKVSANVTGVDAETSYSITWIGGTTSEDGSSCTVTSATADSVDVTASLVVNGETIDTDSVIITFSNRTVTPSVGSTSVSLAINGSTTISPTYTVSDGSKIDCTMTLSSSSDCVSIDGNTITGVKAGPATVTASFATDAENTTIEPTSIDISVTVGTPSISCSSISVKLGSSGTLKPDMDVPDGATVTYSYTPSSSSGGVVSVSPSDDTYSATVYGSSEGRAVVQIAATVKNSNGDTIATSTTSVYVGVYDDVDFTGTMASSTFRAGDACGDAFKSLYKDKGTTNIAVSNPTTTLYALLRPVDGTSIKLDYVSGSTYGGFDSTMTSSPLGSSSLFSSTGVVGTVTYNYTVYDSTTTVIVREGTLKITTSGSTGDIVYSTSGTKKVTFDEDNFLEFWDDQDMDSNLSYVTFNLGDNDYPQYGTLYTASDCKTQVTSTMKFQANYASSASYRDLDTVTYDPTTYASGVQRVTIPFTCVGKTSSEKASGVVVINLSDTGTSITSRGVVFGNEDYDIVGLMKDIFETATGKSLSYVTFPAVDPDTGKLFSSFSDMLSSSQVSKDWKFYVSSTTASQLKLSDVAFVPRAGLYGTVSLSFVGYSGSGDSAACTLTFNVTEKTKSGVFSDVTASSYSWAADSVDFLYYEEVANGSNGKYNPKNNITRGDFMLMLYRAFLEEDYEDHNVTSNFPDVVKGTTSYSKETYQAVGVAKYLGIAQGSNGKYNPTAYITREEAMTLIYRTLDEVGYSMSYTVSTSTSRFSDYSSVSSYAQAAIKDLIGHGVVIGTNGKIQPKSNITRAEMAVILHRVLTY